MAKKSTKRAPAARAATRTARSSAAESAAIPARSSAKIGLTATSGTPQQMRYARGAMRWSAASNAV